MCKLIVGYVATRFRPLYNKTCVWSNSFYNILCCVKQSLTGLAIVITTASSWYKGIGRSLQCLKSPFYSVFKLSHSAKLVNKIGLTALNHSQKLVMCNALCELDKLKKQNCVLFCVINKSVFKLCCHNTMAITEFEFFDLEKYTGFKQTKRSTLKLVLRCTSNHTKGVIRSTVSESLLGGVTLWDLGSGSSGLGSKWRAHGGVNLVCFEKNKFNLRLSIYNTHLILRAHETTKLIGLNYELSLFGISLPDRLFFGCGLKRLASLRLAYTHLKFGGHAVIVSVSNLASVYISLVNFKYKTNSYFLIIRKLKLKLNTKLYTLCSSVHMCNILKRGINIW